MKATTKLRLKRAGWQVGSAQEFLGLSDDEVALIEMHESLTALLRRRRERSGFTQARLAKALGSSQSRVAKLEAGDANVSFELLIRALLALGTSRADIGKALARRTA
jgi:DNA-binding XRE family transcriptional regulator